MNLVENNIQQIMKNVIIMIWNIIINKIELLLDGFYGLQ